MSTSSTRRPASARKADRLIDVIVFPHPPFWLTTAIVRMAPPCSADTLRGVRRAPKRAGIAKLCEGVVAESTPGNSQGDTPLEPANQAWFRAAPGSPARQGKPRDRARSGGPGSDPNSMDAEDSE